MVCGFAVVVLCARSLTVLCTLWLLFFLQHKQSCYCDVFHSKHGGLFLLPSLFLLKPCLAVALGVERL
jgi:hypothetical protein